MEKGFKKHSFSERLSDSGFTTVAVAHSQIPGFKAGDGRSANGKNLTMQASNYLITHYI